MRKSLSIKSSSYMHDTDLYVPEDFNPNPVTTGWRPLAVACEVINGTQTGYAIVSTLEQYTLADGVATAVTKNNSPSDPNYIPRYIDTKNCSYPQVFLNDLVLNNETGKTFEARITGTNSFNRELYGVSILDEKLTPGIYSIDLLILNPDPTKRYRLSATGFGFVGEHENHLSLNNFALPVTFSLVAVNAQTGGGEDVPQGF